MLPLFDKIFKEYERLYVKVVKVLVIQSCPILCDPIVAHQALLSIEFSRQEYWSGQPFPSRGSFRPWDQTRGNLLHYWQILYCLSHQGNPKRLYNEK